MVRDLAEVRSLLYTPGMKHTCRDTVKKGTKNVESRVFRAAQMPTVGSQLGQPSRDLNTLCGTKVP